MWRAFPNTTPSGPCLELAYTSYDKAYLLDAQGRSTYSLTSERATVLMSLVGKRWLRHQRA